MELSLFMTIIHKYKTKLIRHIIKQHITITLCIVSLKSFTIKPNFNVLYLKMFCESQDHPPL
jgi:hypothetical protein